MFDAFLKFAILVQTATPDVTTPMNIQVENLQTQAVGLTAAQWVMLVFYALVCGGLIFCVLTQTSKSEGLMSSMMSAPSQPFRGKKSADDNLTIITTYLAYGFVALSILMALVFK